MDHLRGAKPRLCHARGIEIVATTDPQHRSTTGARLTRGDASDEQRGSSIIHHRAAAGRDLVERAGLQAAAPQTIVDRGKIKRQDTMVARGCIKASGMDEGRDGDRSRHDKGDSLFPLCSASGSSWSRLTYGSLCCYPRRRLPHVLPCAGYSLRVSTLHTNVAAASILPKRHVTCRQAPMIKSKAFDWRMLTKVKDYTLSKLTPQELVRSIIVARSDPFCAPIHNPIAQCSNAAPLAPCRS